MDAKNVSPDVEQEKSERRRDDCEVCRKAFSSAFSVTCRICELNLASAKDLLEHSCREDTSNQNSEPNPGFGIAKVSRQQQLSSRGMSILCEIQSGPEVTIRRKDCFCKICQRSYFHDLKGICASDLEDHYKKFHETQVSKSDPEASGKRNEISLRKVKEVENTFYCHLCKMTFLGKLVNFDLDFHYDTVHKGNIKDQVSKQQNRCEVASNEWVKKEVTEQEAREVSSNYDDDTILNGAESHESTVDESADEVFTLSEKRSNRHRLLCCKLCPKSFSSSRTLQQHQENVHAIKQEKEDLDPDWNVKQEEDDQCDATVENPDPLRDHVGSIHIRKELPDRRVECPYCFAKVWSKLIVTHIKAKHKGVVHMKKDTLEKKVKKCICDLCGKALLNPRALAIHRKNSHESDRIKCDRCDASLKNRRILREHIQKVHEKEQHKRKCPHCEVRAMPDALRQHIRRYHEEPEKRSEDDDPLTDQEDERLKGELLEEGVEDVLMDGFEELETGDFPQEANGLLMDESEGNVMNPKDVLEVVLFTESKEPIDQGYQNMMPIKTEELDVKNSVSASIVEHNQRLHQEDISEEGAAENGSSSGELTCQICGKAFTKLGDLNNHLQDAHKPANDDGSIRCSLCGVTLSSHKCLLEHVQWVHRKAKCSHCGLRASRSYIHSHIRRRHSANNVFSSSSRFACEMCGKEMISSMSLQRHLREVHTSSAEEGASCSACDATFKNRRYLRDHLRRVHGKNEQKVKSCPHCDFSALPNALYGHIQRKHGKQSPCALCGKVFLFEANLRRHLREVHTAGGSKEAVCHTCGAAFKNTRYLQTHINFVHLKEENAKQCPHCEFRTPSHTTIRQHIRTIHEGLKNFVCQFCGKRFSQRGNLASHTANMHGEGKKRPPKKRSRAAKAKKVQQDA